MKRKMKKISDPKDIPPFATEREEADFWATHSLSTGVLEQMQPIPPGELPAPRPRTRPVAIRFDPDVLRRLKALARKKGKGYQTLLKEFVLERLYEEEKREGLVGR